MSVAFTDRAGLPPVEAAALAGELAGLTTLERVLDWCRSRVPALAVADIVTQDEYTHDVLVPLDGERWLVYDTT